MKLIKTLTSLGFTCLCLLSAGTLNAQEVHYMGALRNIMHKGDLSAQASLSDFETTAHLYALGAVENLHGEVQIFNGSPYISYVEDGTLRFDTTFTRNATLLVYSYVEHWEEIEIPETALTYENFETFIAEQASQRGLSLPFPFLINGKAESVNWHTINWPAGDNDHSHEKHIRSGLYGELSSTEVEMLGFYSDAHHAIFTHHTTNMHVHVKTADGTIAGHADGFVLSPCMKLKLPNAAAYRGTERK